jgi:periplasmic protein TonB
VTAAIGAISFRTSVLPWTVAADDERRFKRILRRVLAACLLLALVMPWVPPPTVDRKQVQELPPAFAQLILEREPVKPPPPPPPKPDTEAEATPKADASKPETVKPEPNKKPVPEARQPKPDKPPGEDLANARRKASGVGLLAMKDALADLRSAPVAVQLKPDIKQGPGVGTGTGVGVGAGTDAGTPLRSLITSNATGGSGGINTAGYSRNTGGGGLAGRSTTLVEGVAGGGGGGGIGGGGGSAKGGKGAGGTLQRGASGKASRSIEEIRLVFERNKGAIYAIYNRALREDPTLQGKVVLELKIAPSGEVLDCRVISSELKETELERKLVARIKQFDFGAKDVDQMIVTYPVDFLPS